MLPTIISIPLKIEESCKYLGAYIDAKLQKIFLCFLLCFFLTLSVFFSFSFKITKFVFELIKRAVFRNPNGFVNCRLTDFAASCLSFLMFISAVNNEKILFFFFWCFLIFLSSVGIDKRALVAHQPLNL